MACSSNKRGRIFDRLTGKAGMILDDYIKLFDFNESLNFEVTSIRTIK